MYPCLVDGQSPPLTCTASGADWGDFVSFTKRDLTCIRIPFSNILTWIADMKDKAASYGVDLLIVDTGRPVIVEFRIAVLLTFRPR